MIWEVISGAAVNGGLQAKLKSASPARGCAAYTSELVPITVLVDYEDGTAMVHFRVERGDRRPNDSDRLSNSIEMAMACRFAAYAYDQPESCDAEPGLDELACQGAPRITLTGNDALAVVLGFFEGCLNHLACAA